VNLFRAIAAEIRGIATFVVVAWPNTPLGYFVRQRYWRRHARVSSVIAARGARVSGWEFIRFGEDNAFGENAEFVADGTGGLQVYIGSNILFARGVYLRSTNHSLADRDRHILDQGHESKRVRFEGVEYAIVIEDECWIGANVVILSGAHIGRGAVIAAGAVVTGVIPPFTIAGGLPARVIAERK
jgi:acetyltransferase-like isoleucine patch superfamily enzyme